MECTNYQNFPERELYGLSPQLPSRSLGHPTLPKGLRYSPIFFPLLLEIDTQLNYTVVLEMKHKCALLDECLAVTYGLRKIYSG